MRRFEIAERRARLGVRHHLASGHGVPDVVAATNGMVCLHATDPVTVFLSAWARVPGFTHAAMEAALYEDRTLVKHMAMRRTLFVMDRSLLPIVQAAASNRVADLERRRLIGDIEKHGLASDGGAWLAAAEVATLAALAAAGEATSTELRKLAPQLEGATTYALDKPYGGSLPVGPRVLTVLSAAGRIVRASNRGRWYVSRPAWATMAGWLGADVAKLDPDEARAELARRWLWTFGPATERDLAWWLGDTLTATRAALRIAGATAVDLHGAPGVALADDLEPVVPPEPWAALLPALDPTTMGWFERSWYLGGHRPLLFDTNGNAGPTAWWDGRIVGGWRQRDDATVELQLLEDVGRAALDALEREADRLESLIGDRRVTLRFPSPLFKQ